MANENELQKLKDLSPYSLPDNPSQKGWSTTQIKSKFYQGLFYLYSLFDDFRTTTIDDIDELFVSVTFSNNTITFTRNNGTSETFNIASVSYVDSGLATKQNTLTSGSNITISGSTISATDTTYTLDTNINSTTYVLTITLTDNNGNVQTETIDLPLETMVVNGAYDDLTKKVILTLQSGSTVEFSVADLVNGLATTTYVDTKVATKSKVTASTSESIGADEIKSITIDNTPYNLGGGTPNDATITIQKNSATIGTFTANEDTNTTINIEVPTKTSDLNNDSDFITTSALSGYQHTLTEGTNITIENNTISATDTNTTYTLNATIDTTTYIMTISLTDNGGVVQSKTIDLPLETVVVNGSYNDANQKVVLTLKNGSTIEFSVSDLISGLASTSYVDSAVSTKQNTLVSGTNIKTINSESILGSGNLNVGKEVTFNGSQVVGASEIKSITVDNTSYNLPDGEIPNDATLTIQKNGTTIGTFSADADTDASVNIVVPTKVSDLSNDSGFTTNTGTVTSVRVQAGTGLSSSTSTAQTSTLNTTISVASGYKLPTTTEWNNKANTSQLSSYVTTSTYSTGLSNVAAIAEGKCKAYVTDNFTKINSYTLWEDEETSTNTPSDATWFTVSPSNTIILSGTSTAVTFSSLDLSVGDILYMKDLNVQDWWVGNVSSSYITFYVLETTKVDVANVVANPSTTPSNDLTKITIGATDYNVGQEVTFNQQAVVGANEVAGVTIGNDSYNFIGGASSSGGSGHTLTITTNTGGSVSIIYANGDVQHNVTQSGTYNNVIAFNVSNFTITTGITEYNQNNLSRNGTSLGNGWIMLLSDTTISVEGGN